MILRRMLWSIVFIAVCVFVGLSVIVALFQSPFVYFPTRQIIITPDRMGLSYETVSFETTDGVRLAGWFVSAEPSRGVILFCHGNAGNISDRIESIQVFHRLGLTTFIFDYRGYGTSEGKPTERGTYLDAEAAWRYLVQERHVPPTDIIFFGRSLGGAIVAWLAQEHPPKALIVESTFTSIPDIGADVYPYLPVRLLCRFNYSAVKYVRNVNCPILIVHSRDDEIIPFEHGRRLFEAANEPKEFLEITGTHNEGFITSGLRYRDGVDSFVARFTEK